MAVEVEVDVDAAVAGLQDAQDGLDDAAERIVRQLTVLAEDAMKAEVPEGSGRTVHTRNTITTTFEGDTTGRVRPTKTTASGIPLAEIIVSDPGPWSARPPAAPLIDWADAKLGDPSAGWALREKIFQEGISSFPDPFVSRSMDQWTGQVQDVAGREVAAALGRAGVLR